MSLNASQICSQAREIAKVPGYTAQSGQLLNVILSDLCQTYDFDVIRKIDTSITLGTAAGSGPYALSEDYLRARINEIFYTINGVKYVMVSLELWEFDALVQQAGINNFPQCYATDVSLQANATPVLYVWPPASGSYPLTIRYQPQMPDILTPEVSTDVPWFPNQSYLITRLSGELMRLSDDTRMDTYLGDSPSGAQGILDRYLKLKDDSEGHAQTVQLDRRYFGKSFNRLPNTKIVGWALLFGIWGGSIWQLTQELSYGRYGTESASCCQTESMAGEESGEARGLYAGVESQES